MFALLFLNNKMITGVLGNRLTISEAKIVKETEKSYEVRAEMTDTSYTAFPNGTKSGSSFTLYKSIATKVNIRGKEAILVPHWLPNKILCAGNFVYPVTREGVGFKQRNEALKTIEDVVNGLNDGTVTISQHEKAISVIEQNIKKIHELMEKRPEASKTLKKSIANIESAKKELII